MTYYTTRPDMLHKEAKINPLKLPCKLSTNKQCVFDHFVRPTNSFFVVWNI